MMNKKSIIFPVIFILTLSLIFPTVTNPNAGIGESEFGYPTVYGIEITGQKERVGSAEITYLGDGQYNAVLGKPKLMENNRPSIITQDSSFVYVDAQTPFKVNKNTCELNYLESKRITNNPTITGIVNFIPQWSDDTAQYFDIPTTKTIPLQKAVVTGNGTIPAIPEHDEPIPMICEVLTSQSGSISDVVTIKKTQGDYITQVPIHIYFDKYENESFPSVVYTGDDVGKYYEILEKTTITDNSIKIEIDGSEFEYDGASKMIQQKDVVTKSLQLAKSTVELQGADMTKKQFVLDKFNDRLTIEIPQQDQHLLKNVVVKEELGNTVIEKRFTDGKLYLKNQKFEYDPTFTSTSTSATGRVYSISGTGTSCPAYSNGDANVSFARPQSDISDACQIPYWKYDTSSLQDNIVISSITWEYDKTDTNGHGTSTDDGVLVKLSNPTNDATTYNEGIAQATLYTSASAVTIDGAVTDTIVSFSASGISDVESLLASGQDYIGFGVTTDSLTRAPNDSDGSGLHTFSNEELVIIYSIPIVNNPPVFDSMAQVTDTSDLTLTFSNQTEFNNSTQTFPSNATAYELLTLFQYTPLDNSNSTQQSNNATSKGAIDTSTGFKGIFHFDSDDSVTLNPSGNFTDYSGSDKHLLLTNSTDGNSSNSATLKTSHIDSGFSNELQFVKFGGNITNADIPSGTESMTFNAIVTPNNTDIFTLFSAEGSGGDIVANMTTTFIDLTINDVQIFNATGLTMNTGSATAITITRTSTGVYELYLNGTAQSLGITDTTSFGTITDDLWFIGMKPDLTNSGTWRLDELSIESQVRSNPEAFGHRILEGTEIASGITVTNPSTADTYTWATGLYETVKCAYLTFTNTVDESSASNILCQTTDAEAVSSPGGSGGSSSSSGGSQTTTDTSDSDPLSLVSLFTGTNLIRFNVVNDYSFDMEWTTGNNLEIIDISVDLSDAPGWDLVPQEFGPGIFLLGTEGATEDNPSKGKIKYTVASPKKECESSTTTPGCQKPGLYTIPVQVTALDGDTEIRKTIDLKFELTGEFEFGLIVIGIVGAIVLTSGIAHTLHKRSKHHSGKSNSTGKKKAVKQSINHKSARKR